MAYRIFISGVSTEFESARDAVADGLQAKGLEVKVQRSFRQGENPSTLLKKLHDYIRDCDAVICIIGSHSGSYPPDTADFLPNEMLPDGIERASYTQWEFHFARHFKKKMYRYFASVDWKPDRIPNSENDAEHQQQFVQSIKDSNLDRSPFSSAHELRANVFLENWPDHTKPKPNNLPQSTLGSLFKGRDQFLVDMREKLTAESSEATAITTQAVYGAGGIGKTRAAVEYAWRFVDQYEAVLFLSAETPSLLNASLANLVGVLNIEGMEQATDDVRLKAVFDWLQLHPGWLAILDNVDTDESVKEVKEKLAKLSQGHVLITSRISKWSAGVETLDLGLLPMEAAIEYLQQAADQRDITADDEEKASEVAEKVGQLALGLEHATAYINVRNWSFAEYIEQWNTNEESILNEFDLDLIEYPRELLVTWKMSVNLLPEDAKRLLEILSWFAPEPIPITIFESIPEGILENDPQDAINTLVRYSLVERQTIDGERSLQVHRLVQATTRYHIRQAEVDADEQTKLQSLNVALKWISASLPEGHPGDVRTWPQWEPLLPHVGLIAAEADRFEVDESPSYIMNNLGVLLSAKALYAEAEPLKRRALEIDEKAYGREDPRVAIRLNNLAQLLQSTNRLEKAEPLMRRALKIDEKAYGKEHPSVATNLNNLAQLLKATNRLEEAEPLMRRALKIDEKAYRKEHPDVARDLNNLAQLLQATNRLEEAEPLMWRALEIDEKVYEKEHPSVARDLNNLALLLQATNHFEQAEPLMRRALKIDEKAYGKEHPDVAIRLNNLALLLQSTNGFGEAEPLIRRAVKILHQFGVSNRCTHPDLQTVIENYRSILSDMKLPEDEISKRLQPFLPADD